MIKSIPHYIGLQYGIFSVRWKKDEQQNLTQFLSGSRNALLIMPEDRKAAEYAVVVIQQLQQRFSRQQITIVATPVAANILGKIGGAEIIRLADSDIGPFGLPRKSFIDKLNKRHYDLVIDLNILFVLFASYLTKKVYSKYRLSFAKRYGDTFYNIQYRNISGQSTQLTYRSLCTFLNNF
jgi:ADP-heptose:LPS heptosyltransferase